MSNSTPQKPSEQRSKSCETACSSNSSCFFQRRKPINPLASSLRSSVSRSTGNSVRQRVLSAKLLKLKSVQNQLNDANFHLAEVIRENQALKTLQKRQDRALAKYEGANAELPKLIKSHEEEIRFLSEKNKQMRKNMKELNDQLKYRNDEVMNLQEQLKHYEKLDKDKRLLEREKLVEELEDVKMKLQKADNEIVTLNRKLTLESKTSKQRLNMELAKHKQCQRELTQALAEITRLTKLLETKDKSSNHRKRFSNLAPRQSTSLTSLNGTKHLLQDYDSDKLPVTEVKLEPLSQSRDFKDDDNQKTQKGILKCPSENIKARLSANLKNIDGTSLDKTSSSGSEVSIDKEVHQSRPNSCQKLQKIERNLQNTIRKVENDKNSDEFSKQLGDYYLKAIDSVKDYNNLIESHKVNLTHAKQDTKRLVETVRNVGKVEKEIKKSTKMLSMGSGDSSDDNFDFISQILKEEAEFQVKYPDSNRNGKKKEPAVGQNDKKKLLATLRAIDNGDSVETFSGDSQEKNQIGNEVLENVSI